MSDASSPTGVGHQPDAIQPDDVDDHRAAVVEVGNTIVIASDERPPGARPNVDVARWADLAARCLDDCGERGELQLVFVDEAEIADLNRQHMGIDRPTDVLSFPLDAGVRDPVVADGPPRLLGDIVVCPAVASAAAPTHAGTIDDELALLVVHGVLHVVGHDHVEPEETAAMRAREADLLSRYHWDGAVPAGFRHDHAEPATESR